MRYILIGSHLRRVFIACVQVHRRLQPLRESVGDLYSVAFTKSLVQSELRGVVPGFAVVIGCVDRSKLWKRSQQTSARDGPACACEQSATGTGAAGHGVAKRISHRSAEGGIVSLLSRSARIVEVQKFIRHGIDVSNDFNVVALVSKISQFHDPAAKQLALNTKGISRLFSRPGILIEKRDCLPERSLLS